MKTCHKCKLEKNESDFSLNRTKFDGLNSECKECQKKYFKEYYAKNKDAHVKRVTKTTNYRRALIGRIKLEKGCKICGYNSHPAALQFHHRDQKEKEFTIGINIHLPLEIVKKEIEKCDILCANCHSIHHSSYDWTAVKKPKKTRQRKSKNIKERTIANRYKKKERIIVKKTNIPDDETLQRLLFEFPAEDLGKMFNCSGSYLSKYCKQRNLNKPGRGYWTKVKRS